MLQRRTTALVAGAALLAAPAMLAWAQEGRYFIFPEQRRIEVRPPEALPAAPLPPASPPPTVATFAHAAAPWPLSLDEAIRIALGNAEVVRVLAGTTAIASGQTIYDPAIINTQIDQERGRFDPALFSNSAFARHEMPQGTFDPFGNAVIDGTTFDSFQNNSGIAKDFATGGNFGASVNAVNTDTRLVGPPLNPDARAATEIRATQPLLQGAGARVNLAPILIARIHTERSFFQLKDAVQDLVQGTIDAYWQLVYAEVNTWARERQVEQAREALSYAEERLKAGFGNEADVAQARVAYENFRASHITAQADLLDQEATLRNLLGLPPADGRRIQPTTPLSTLEYQADWNYLRMLAETYRPDIIQQKLLIETDQQQLILARNRTLPQLDVGAVYRWNHLEGRTPTGTWLRSGPGQFTEWEYGINFAMPLGQRTARGALRQEELNLFRDQANLDQSLHAATHAVATSVRRVAQHYQQYQAFRRTREAAWLNLQQQKAEAMQGRAIYLNVLQAIVDWGNAVANESQAIVLYNTELANLERETGTILETHGVRFVDELYGSLGPLGRFAKPVCYPQSLPPGPNADQPLPPDDHRYIPERIMRLPPVDPREEIPPAP